VTVSFIVVKKVGVLGYKDFALSEANELLHFTDDVTIFTNGQKTEFDSSRFSRQISDK